MHDVAATLRVIRVILCLCVPGGKVLGGRSNPRSPGHDTGIGRCAYLSAYGNKPLGPYVYGLRSVEASGNARQAFVSYPVKRSRRGPGTSRA